MSDSKDFITGVVIAFFGIVGGILSVAFLGSNLLVVSILIIASIATVFVGIVYAIPSARKKLFKR